MRQFQFGLVALLVLGLASVASATPVYVGPPGYGGECPSDAMGPFTKDDTYQRQYYVDPSLRCVFESDKDTFNNLQGTDAEADYYLNSLLANAAGWGTIAGADDWNGIGQDNGADENIVGFGFTTDAENDSGSFIISPLLGGYNQFAVAIKDGALPFWAIFELGVGQYTGDWGFGTDGGDLSHFALYGRFVPSDDDEDPPVVTEVPEPASMLLLGAGLAVGGKIRSRRKKQ
jgi:hypothetical protein